MKTKGKRIEIFYYHYYFFGCIIRRAVDDFGLCGVETLFTMQDKLFYSNRLLIYGDNENKRNVLYQLISKDMEITPGWNFTWFYYVFCLFLPFISFCVIRNSCFVMEIAAQKHTHKRTCQNHFINERIALVTIFFCKDFPRMHFCFCFCKRKNIYKKNNHTLAITRQGRVHFRWMT